MSNKYKDYYDNRDVISLFSGAMGLDIGLGKAGLNVVIGQDSVVTSPVQKATMMCHPVLDRPLSLSEYARIQQFPDEWIFAGTVAAKYRQIGNAVPVGLAEAIGKSILSTADKTSTIVTKRFRGTAVHSKIKNAMELGGSTYGNQ